MRVVRVNLLRCAFMNILIENAESLEYSTGNGEWTKKVGDAKIFGTTGTALAAAKKELIRTFNIVRHIPQSNQFVNLNHGRGKGAAETVAVLESVPAVQA